MKRTVLGCVFALGAAAAWAAGAGAQDSTRRVTDTTRQTILLDRVVAAVGSKPITQIELLEAIQQEIARREANKEPPLPNDSVLVMRLMLDALINEELVVQKAKEYKIEVADETITPMVDDRFKAARAQFQTEEEFRAALRGSGIESPEALRRRFMDEARRQKMRATAIDSLKSKGKIPTVSVSEREIRAYWDSVHTRYPDRGVRVTWRQIIMRATPSDSAHQRARARAESLLVAVKAGADFDSLARIHSADSVSGAKGGDLGWFRRGEMQPEFEKWSFGLQMGQLSPVFQTRYGYHFLKVDRVRRAEVSARHVLIIPVADSSDVDRSEATMRAVAAAIRAGANFDSLATLYNDEPTEDRLFDDIRAEYAALDNLRADYREKLGGLKPREVTDPFRLPAPDGGLPKVGVLQLLARAEAGAPTYEDYRERIRAQLQNVQTERRLYDELRKEIRVDIRLDDKPAKVPVIRP